MKIYIAGPITGDPDYKKKFDAAVIEKNLAEYAGISVVTLSLADFAELMELPREET